MPGANGDWPLVHFQGSKTGISEAKIFPEKQTALTEIKPIKKSANQ